MIKTYFFPILKALFALMILAAITHFWQKYDAERYSHNRPGILGQAAPDITLGNGISLSKWRGKTMLVHFWATWCGPCLKELPEIAELAPQWQKTGIQLVLIAVDRDWALVNDFLARDSRLQKLTKDGALFLDPDSRIAAAFQSNQFPETFLINRDFVVDNKWVGAQNWSSPELRTILERIPK